MNEMLQMLNQLRNSPNPMMLMQQMFGDNPIFNNAMRMAQGKSPQEMQQLIRNIAYQRGMSDMDLNNFLSQFNLRF